MIVLKDIREFKFWVRPDSSDHKALKEVILRNSYQRRNFQIDPGEKWMDLGGNIGAFSILAASKGAFVKTYEPDPESSNLLQQNVEINGFKNRIEIHQKAVLTTPEKSITLHVNSANKNYWRNSVIKTWRGGNDVEVQAVHFAAIYRGENLKIDIEGSEMPLLEMMIDFMTPGTFPNKMVFEWSFDIDNSIPRFKNVIEKLKKEYPSVIYGKFDETQPIWPSNWFPPAKMVWCKK
jgi:FkbM family methyltransferase